MNCAPYHDEICNQAVEKIKKGAKHLLIAIPVGYGRSKVLGRIAELLCMEDDQKALFILSHKVLVDMFCDSLASIRSRVDLITYKQFEENPKEYLSDKVFVFVDTLSVSNRRSLTMELSRFDGCVITTTRLPIFPEEDK